MSSSRLFVALSFVLGAQCQNFARLIPQQERRANNGGGWPLGIPGTSCPAFAPVKCADGYNPACCPSGNTCYGNLNPRCCPIGSDCVLSVQNFPTCANSTWNMFVLGAGPTFFCCEPGLVGLIPFSGYTGLCEPPDQSIGSNIIASAASQVAGSGPVTVVPVPSSTSTVTSTLTNGVVTTITTAVAGSTATATTTSGSPTSTPSSCSPGTNNVCISPISLGAKIGLGIAFGIGLAALVGAIMWCYRRRRARRDRLNAALVGAGYNAGINGGPIPMQQQGYAPEYTQSPPQLYFSPVPEYKNPVVGVHQTGYAQTPPPQTPIQHQGGYVPPTPQYHGGSAPVEAPDTPVQHQGGYVAPRPQYEGGSAPVEAPQSWERGL